MIINNTYTVKVKDAMGDDNIYVFNLKHCMYLSRTSPHCIRLVFGTRNLVFHFNSLEAVSKYLPVFVDYLEGNVKNIEVSDDDFESCEIEIRE